MEANVYDLEGKVQKKVSLPKVFECSYNEDMIKRALLAEQSEEYQPQGRDILAGMRTSAQFVGRLGNYRSQRHTGRPPRPRQMLARGGVGAVRRIPSAVKGRRAHPQKVEKRIVEKINRKEYIKALESAVAATGNMSLIKKTHIYAKETFPIAVSSEIEKISRTKDLMKIIASLGLMEDLEKSHKPRKNEGSSRRSKKRYFRNSLLFVVKDAKVLGKAGRNIPGASVLEVDRLRISAITPGAKPVLTLWSESALQSLTEGITNSAMRRKGWVK